MTSPEPFRVLAVCHANRCRSPILAGLLRAGLASVGIEHEIASAGFLEGGFPADPHSVEVMANRGMAIASHRSHQIRAIDIDAADLVITMDPEQVIRAVELNDDGFDRSFTIRELNKLGRASGPRKDGETHRAWLRRVGAGRERNHLLQRKHRDGIVDPIGGSIREFERTAKELETLAWAIVDLLSGYEPKPE